MEKMENIVNEKNWKSLIKPTKLDKKLSDDKSYAKIIAEPLEKGYGLTLGNSLRRILLSSIRYSFPEISIIKPSWPTSTASMRSPWGPLAPWPSWPRRRARSARRA